MKDPRGGARERAGRKPLTISQKALHRMLAAERKMTKETGKTIDDILLHIIYGKNVKNAERVAAIKVWKDYTMVKVTENTTTLTNQGPVITLPAMEKVGGKEDLTPTIVTNMRPN